MNCREFLPLIEEVFDGEADRKTARRVEEHLAVCAACAAAFETLRGEQELYLRYDFEAAPSHAFWEGVAARTTTMGGEGQERAATALPAQDAAAAALPINTHERAFWPRLRRLLAAVGGASGAPRFSPTLTAALVLIAVALTIGVMRYLNTQERATNEIAGRQTDA